MTRNGSVMWDTRVKDVTVRSKEGHTSTPTMQATGGTSRNMSCAYRKTVTLASHRVHQARTDGTED